MTSQATNGGKATFAANVKAAREAKGWTQKDLAARIGVDALAVSRWERHTIEVRPSTENLMALASVLDRSADWFDREPLEPAA